jgi:hypothetical protein
MGLGSVARLVPSPEHRIADRLSHDFWGDFGEVGE